MSVIVALAALLSGPAHAADTVLFTGDGRRALTLVERDADVPADRARAVPIQAPATPRVVGDLVGVPCRALTPPQTLTDALQRAEAMAIAGEEGLGKDSLRAALAALRCLDAPLRAGEAALVHDLASAYALRFDDDRQAAIDASAQALVADPGFAPVYQADPSIVDAARDRLAAAPTSTLWLPPDLPPFTVLVDGRPATGAVTLLPGEHVVQHLGQPLTSLVIDVPDASVTGALALPDVPLDALSLDAPEARAWLTVVLAADQPEVASPWLVQADRVWRPTPEGWLRYDRRPPRALRPALLGLTAVGVAAGLGTVGGMGARWGTLEACGTTLGAPGKACAPYANGVTGLVTDIEGWTDARRTAAALTITGAVVAVASSGLLAMVATRSRAPHAVLLSAAPTASGAALTATVVPGVR